MSQRLKHCLHSLAFAWLLNMGSLAQAINNNPETRLSSAAADLQRFCNNPGENFWALPRALRHLHAAYQAFAPTAEGQAVLANDPPDPDTTLAERAALLDTYKVVALEDSLDTFYWDLYYSQSLDAYFEPAKRAALQWAKKRKLDATGVNDEWDVIELEVIGWIAAMRFQIQTSPKTPLALDIPYFAVAGRATFDGLQDSGRVE